MKKWLDTFLEEKGIDMDTPIDVMGENGMNYMTVGVVAEHIYITTKKEKEQIKKQLVNIDFHNASVLDFFIYLAKRIAR
jgi:hypothetical protein